MLYWNNIKNDSYYIKNIYSYYDINIYEIMILSCHFITFNASLTITINLMSSNENLINITSKLYRPTVSDSCYWSCFLNSIIEFSSDNNYSEVAKKLSCCFVDMLTPYISFLIWQFSEAMIVFIDLLRRHVFIFNYSL